LKKKTHKYLIRRTDEKVEKKNNKKDANYRSNAMYYTFEGVLSNF